MDFYSTAEDVIESTGIKPKDLGKEDDAELTALIEKWLAEIKDIIDHDRRRDFLIEADGNPNGVPKLVHNVARRMCGNMVALAILRRETPIIKIDDFAVKMVGDSVLTKDIRKDLALIPRGTTRATPLRFWRVRNKRQLEQEDAG